MLSPLPNPLLHYIHHYTPTFLWLTWEHFTLTLPFENTCTQWTHSLTVVLYWWLRWNLGCVVILSGVLSQVHSQSRSLETHLRYQHPHWNMINVSPLGTDHCQAEPQRWQTVARSILRNICLKRHWIKNLSSATHFRIVMSWAVKHLWHLWYSSRESMWFFFSLNHFEFIFPEGHFLQYRKITTCIFEKSNKGD